MTDQIIDPIDTENTAPDASEVVGGADQKDNLSLQQQYDALQRQYSELQEICKKAQNDYIMLKVDFDQYQNRTHAAQKDQAVSSLIDVVKKFLPFIDGLEKSLATVGESHDNPLVKGVKMTYDNFIKVLEGLAITPIESIGLKPDSLLHEPIGTMPVEDEDKKGTIVHEIQKGFVYKKNDTQKVVQSAKVMLGQ